MKRLARILGLSAIVAVAAFPFWAVATAPSGQYGTNCCPANVYDYRTQLTWEQASNAALRSFSEALYYCRNAPWYGRLPTLRELLSIADDGSTTSVALEPTVFPGEPVGPYWSSTPLAGSTTQGWVVSFANPPTTTTIAFTTPRRVRCVK